MTITSLGCETLNLFNVLFYYHILEKKESEGHQLKEAACSWMYTYFCWVTGEMTVGIRRVQLPMDEANLESV
jgi:hypothetical protein